MVASDDAGVDRLNVALVPDAVAALDRLQEATGLKKVDLANRALQLYALIETRRRAGATLLLRDADGVDREVWIL